MQSRWAASVFVCVCQFVCSIAASAVESSIQVAAGAGNFAFVDERGDASKRMTIYTYLPHGISVQAVPIVFVLHGVSKNAQTYRDTWIPLADRHGFMVIAPLFDREQWSRGAYSYASIHDRDGKLQDSAMWSFNVIEHLFDAIKIATGNASSNYFIYGHSEGGQFVHRLVLLLPDARYARAVAANPGWYTRPTHGIEYPYGLRGAPVSATALKASLQRDFVLLLGELDVDPNRSDLRRTREAMAQGRHRFERGHNFMNEARASAAELGASLRWKIVSVPGAGHENGKMSGPAAQVLMAR